MDYDTMDIVSINMKACYPASFQDHGEAAPCFKRFGHHRNRMIRVAINGALPKDIGTGFARVRSWEFSPECHVVVAAWFGKHFEEKGCAPTQLLAYLVATVHLANLEVTDAI